MAISAETTKCFLRERKAFDINQQAVGSCLATIRPRSVTAVFRKSIIMIKSILVGLNGTETSNAAAEYALRLASETRAKLVGLAVLDPTQVCPSESVPLGAGEFKRARDAALLESAQDHRSKLLRDFEQRCQAAGITAATYAAEGDPARELCAHAQRVDLLVVGKKDESGQSPLTSHATLQAILHHAPRPVLCIPVGAKPRLPIMITYDGSLPAARAVHSFVHSGLQADRPVHLLCCGERAAEIAEPCLDYLAAHGIQAEQHLTTGTPAEQILQFADRLQAGLLVMGAYGQTRFHELFFGSTTATVLQRTGVPLYLDH